MDHITATHIEKLEEAGLLDLVHLKSKAKKDLLRVQLLGLWEPGNERGFSELVIKGQRIVVTAQLIGYNKPNRTKHIRYTTNIIGV